MSSRQRVSRDLTIPVRQRKKSGESIYLALAFTSKIETYDCILTPSNSIQDARPKFRETNVIAYASEFISEAEFFLLYYANKQKNPEIPFVNYESFDLDSMTDDMCKTK